MQIFQGYSDNRVLTRDNNEYTLPFSTGLKDFRIEYYEVGNLYVQTHGGDLWKLPAQAGKKYSLGRNFGTIEVVRIFRNFKIDAAKGAAAAYTSKDSHPALQVPVTSPEGQTLSGYVFEPSRGYMYPSDNFTMAYVRDIKDFVSELQVIEDDKVVAAKPLK